MARVTSIVLKLDDGKYRKVKMKKVKSMFIDEKYMCNGKVEPGEDDVAGPPTEEPDFSPDEPAPATRGGNGDNGETHCYLVNGVLICV